MKLRQVLMGGLLLTVPFAACTNEELMDVTVPSTPEEVISKAVSLGEDFTIVGEKGISTRAIIKDDLSGSIWEKTDTVGGAWYAVYDKGSDNGSFINEGKDLFSNHPFAFSKDLGGMATVEFKANTNAFAGKYLLYYPYDHTVAAVSETIPVEFEQNPEMDCTAGKELDHVNRNLFAWCDAEFKEGGSQAGAFKLKQAGNVAIIRLGSTSENLDRIQGKSIEKVILESTGKLYNKATIEASGNNYKEGKGEYVHGTAINTYILTPKNAGDDYKITAADKAGMTKKAFYLSMLPADKEITDLTVRVIMSDGRIFSKELVKDENAELFARMISSEKKLEMNVILDTEENADNIYTEEQFNTALARAATTAGAPEINLAADLTLPSLDFNMRNKVVTIKGSSLTVTGGLTVTDGNLKIASNLIAKDKVTVAEYGNLNVEGNKNELGALEVDGAAVVKKSKIASAEVTKAAKLGLEATEVTGTFTIGRSADVTLNGVTLKGTTRNIEGDIKLETTATKNYGTFTSEEGSISAEGVALNNYKTMTLSGVTVTGAAGIINGDGGTLNVNGKAATITTLTNDEAKPATDTEPAKAAGTINVDMADADAELTITALTNGGYLNINKGKLTGTNSGNESKILGATSETRILENGVLNIGALENVGTEKARIIIVKNGNIVGSGSLATGVEIATEINSATGNWFTGYANRATTIILNAEGLSLDSETHETLLAKTLVLKKSIKIAKGGSVDFTMTGALNVEGNVTISADAATVLTLAASTVENSVKGVLTIGKNVTLTADGSGSKINLNNGGGSVVKVTGGNIQGDITYVN